MKDIILPLAGTALFIIVVGLFSSDPGRFIKQKNNNNSEFQKIVKVNDIEINTEVADNKKERNKGLSERKSLGEKQGMLFIFENKNTYPTFWMKNTFIPLDIIWIDDGEVSQITKNVQPEEKNISDKELKIYSPEKPVDYVLEVNANFCDENNIEVGNTVDLTSAIEEN